MNIKKKGIFLSKIIFLSLIMTFIFLISSSLVMSEALSESNHQNNGLIISTIFLVNLINILVITFIIKHSSWQGKPLMIGLGFSFFGVLTFMGQIEALAFLTEMGESLGSGNIPVIKMPVDIIMGHFVIGILISIIVIPLTVKLLSNNETKKEINFKGYLKKVLGNKQWIWKAAAIIIIYELLYFGFGYYVAWRSTVIQTFYQGTDPGSFFLQLKYIMNNTPMLFLFQALRALVWTIFALPVINMMKNKPKVGIIATAIMLGIPMNIQHIIPNVYMPASVRLVHFIETATSTTIFGAILFLILYKKHNSFKEIFQLV